MAAQPRRIVVGYDGSAAAQRALDAAADLTGYGSTLTVVTVATDAVAGTALTEARERLLRQHVPANYVQTVGDPAEEIVAAACELDADLVVVGRRHSGHRSGAAVGPLNTAILRQVPCDVLVVSERS